jgi:hypothetical protein
MIIRRPIGRRSELERGWDRFMKLNEKVSRQHEAYRQACQAKAAGDLASACRILRDAGIAEEVIDRWARMPAPIRETEHFEE